MIMQSISDKSPCKTCKEDRQIGNPDVWQSPCYYCSKKTEWEVEVLTRLKLLEKILGSEYDPDHLKGLVETKGASDND